MQAALHYVAINLAASSLFLVGAALLVAVWKIMTGGIHLDGLADCLDGLAGPDAARRRAIMRDSRIGVFGAAGLGLALILFVTSLSELPAPIRSRVLLLAPVLGRVSPLLAAAWLRPATRNGAGVAAGTVVTTRTWVGILDAAEGDLVSAELPGIGRASVQL